MQAERSFPDLLRDIAGHFQEIIRSELRLAKTEVMQESGRAISPLVTLSTGIVLGLYSLGALLVTIGFALAIVLTSWLAALVVSIFSGILAAILISAGVNSLKRVHGVPKRTLQVVGENMEWTKHQIR